MTILKVGEETNLQINKQVEFRVNALGTHVTIATQEGEYTLSVKELEQKLADKDLLIPVRKMFQSMMDYYTENLL